MSLRTFVLALAGAASVPAFAQAQAPAAAATPGINENAAPKPQMIKKTVCRRVDDEENTGSRLGAAPKICKVIEVPAPADGVPKPELGSR